MAEHDEDQSGTRRSLIDRIRSAAEHIVRLVRAGRKLRRQTAHSKADDGHGDEGRGRAEH